MICYCTIAYSHTLHQRCKAKGQHIHVTYLYVCLLCFAVSSWQNAESRNGDDSDPASKTDWKSKTGEKKPRWHKRIWNQLIHQETPGRRALFRLRFCVCFFLGLCIMFLVGGGFFLSFSLRQVQIRVTYSNAAPLAGLSNEERSMLLQGQSAHIDSCL